MAVEEVGGDRWMDEEVDEVQPLLRDCLPTSRLLPAIGYSS